MQSYIANRSYQRPDSTNISCQRARSVIAAVFAAAAKDYQQYLQSDRLCKEFLRSAFDCN